MTEDKPMQTTVIVGHNRWQPIADVGFAFFRYDRAHQRMWAAEPIVWTERKRENFERELPLAFGLSREEAQKMMDELWAFGIRPSDQGSPGQLAAINSHLSDMRAIAFGKLRIEMP